MKLHRYWITFQEDPRLGAAGVRLGCGATAWTMEDALTLARDHLFQGGALPPVASIITDIDVRTLDAGHVLPNIGAVNLRGVWYPHLAYSQ